jgi:hypothetical protein
MDFESLRKQWEMNAVLGPSNLTPADAAAIPAIERDFVKAQIEAHKALCPPPVRRL